MILTKADQGDFVDGGLDLSLRIAGRASAYTPDDSCCNQSSSLPTTILCCGRLRGKIFHAPPQRVLQNLQAEVAWNGRFRRKREGDGAGLLVYSGAIQLEAALQRADLERLSGCRGSSAHDGTMRRQKSDFQCGGQHTLLDYNVKN